ncbi:MAG: hypothetical protein ACTS41_01445 [Candidatus Hodgkinia cicadicola]
MRVSPSTAMDGDREGWADDETCWSTSKSVTNIDLNRWTVLLLAT